jgi:hypothetical protein
MGKDEERQDVVIHAPTAQAGVKDPKSRRQKLKDK